MPEKKATRHKTKHYAAQMYSARLPVAEARLVDDYAAAHGLRRTDVVRMSVHHFVLRQHLRHTAKSTASAPPATATAEQVQQCQARLEELAALLHELAARPHTSPPVATSTATPLTHPDAVAQRQQQLLEQLLVTVMLTLRLQVNYTVAPVLAALASQDAAALAPHLELASQGREQWSAATRAVFQRTGQRILQELAQAAT